MLLSLVDIIVCVNSCIMNIVHLLNFINYIVKLIYWEKIKKMYVFFGSVKEPKESLCPSVCLSVWHKFV